MAEKKTTEAAETQEVKTEAKEPAKKKAEPKKKADTAKLQAELDKVNEALAESKDMLLRTAAEFDNFKKRSQKEREELYNMTVCDTIEKLLPVKDNLERAAGAADAAESHILEGINMIIKQLDDILSAMGVEKIKTVGEEFNPELHNAVMKVEDDSLGENTIAQVFQKGYKTGDKIIRHAMVQVAN